MASKISVVINTYNEEKDIERALESVKWAMEIIVCDMHSTDKTVELAKKAGAKIIWHPREEVVERARNFAVSKASGDWILIIDPDEEIPVDLVKKLQQIADNMKQIDYVRIPRSNLIFGKVLKHSGWWPDLNIRFFKKGKVTWTDEIHRPPKVTGEGLDLEDKEQYAIIHHSYKSVSQFLERMNRYTAVQANELIEGGYKFDWKDLFEKPLSEFLSRFFALEGYKDGLHGLVLGLLQAFSCLIVYLKLWEAEKFKQEDLVVAEVKEQTDKSGYALNYWFKQTRRGFLSNLFKRK